MQSQSEPVPPDPADATVAPSVAAIVPVREPDLAHLDRALAEIRAQEGAPVRAVVVDQTLGGELEGRDLGGALVLRESSPSRGLALARGAEASDAEVLLVWEACASYPTDRAARQLAALEAHPLAQLVTGDLGLVTDERGADDAPYTRTRALDLAHDDLPGLWQATLCVRRPLLSTIDRAAFAPSEYGLLVAARACDAWAHAPGRVAAVDAAASAARDEAVRVDAELVRLARLEPLATPELTVLLATHDRCDVLLACIEAFARQLVRPGTFEIVVVDDASRDATPRVMRDLRTHAPLVFDRQPLPGGAGPARNLGLPRARGRFVLFVNDDTIPDPHLVRRHLEAHRELGDGAMVQGLFRQPDAILANALNRVLDDSRLVFGFRDFAPGQELVGAQLYTCNVSVATEAVRAIGGFDASYSTYGCEDTDLGERLVAAGQHLVYRPECVAAHQHRLAFDDFVARQVQVARAHVRVYRDHPHLCPIDGLRGRTVATLRADLADRAATRASVERAARELSEVDLAALEGADGAARASAARIHLALSEALHWLHDTLWIQGLAEGLEREGVDDFDALLCANAQSAGARGDANDPNTTNDRAPLAGLEASHA